MDHPVNLILYSGAALLIAFVASWLYIKTATAVQSRLEPDAESVLRVRAAGCVYRSRLVGLGPEFWTISAPLNRDCFVPIRPGEEVVVEAACKGGALVFRSHVLERSAGDHTFRLERPKEIHKLERREHRRWPEFAGRRLEIEGMGGEVVDLAEGGARIRTRYRTDKGERVKLGLPWGEIAYGWVLSREGEDVRVRFEELIAPKPA